MRRVLVIGVAGAILVLSSATSFAQSPPEVPVVVQGRLFQGPEGGPPPAPVNTFVFVASEGFGGKTVKGAPYSAEAVTETIQTLGDGNRIVNRTTSTLYRDNEGRTRREQTLNAIGGFANGGEPIQTIFINDPVAGVSYALDSRTNTAHKTMPLKVEQKLRLEKKPLTIGASPVDHAGEQKFEYKIETRKGAPGVPLTPAHPIRVPEGEQFTIKTESGGIGYVMTRKTTAEDRNAVKESLGRQLVEGVQADGTRVTITIPAGEIGNERPIQIVRENWYSPELQMVVMSRHTDPRSGETTYRLTNINRAEPAKSLFEVPPGFTVSEGLPGGVWKQGPLPKAKKVVNPE
jgi:hypothetical protein